MVGVEVAARVGVMLGVSVQPGGMVGKFWKMEQADIVTASKSPRKRRMYFIPFLYWQKRETSSKVAGCYMVYEQILILI
jgi:hypothetical protein